MKTKTSLLTLHRLSEKNLKGQPQRVWYVSDGTKVQHWKKKEQIKFLDSIQPGQEIRVTMVNSTDHELIGLSKRGARILYANWHSVGVARGLTPEEIVAAFAAADASHFRGFVARTEIAELRDALATRNAILSFYNDAKRRLKQVARNQGILEDAENHPDMKDSFDYLDEIDARVVMESGEGSMDMDARVTKIAQTIPECKLFNEIAGIKGKWIMAASIVAYAGGIDRFNSVASFWHYMGQHVVEGKSPKRQTGVPVDWSPNGRRTVYQLGSSIIKNGSQSWRDYYQGEKERELAIHHEKHPDCPSPDGHCGARARRKMCKRILMRFYLAATDKSFDPKHVSIKPFQANKKPSRKTTRVTAVA